MLLLTFALQLPTKCISMNYPETLAYLYAQLPMFQRIGKKAYKADLSTSLQLDAYFQHPHKHYPCVHVAGTNGKGSTSHSLAAILQRAGYKVGLYTSPHLLDFRERVRINGEMISEQYVIAFVQEHHQYWETLSPSFFEITVALAFQYFKDEEVDVAIIETGLGGLLDSTNIIDPVCSLITNVSLDHTDLLGKTVADIAIQKAGIIKPTCPVVMGDMDEQARRIINDEAQAKSSPVIDAALIQLSKDKTSYHWVNGDFKLDISYALQGDYQFHNLQCVLACIPTLQKQGFVITYDHIQTALNKVPEMTGLAGRWQVISDAPLTICDTGHNVAAFKEISKQLGQLDCKQLHWVLGFAEDKDTDQMLSLLPQEAYYYFCAANIQRALSPNILKEKANQHNLKGEIFYSTSEAYQCAQLRSSKEDVIFIGGSTFLVAEIMSFLSKSE